MFCTYIERNNNTLSSTTTISSGIKDIVIPDSKIITSEEGLESFFSSGNNDSPQFQCITIHDFYPEGKSEDQLTIRKGDLLQIWIPSGPPSQSSTSTNDEDDKNDTVPEWWYGRLANKDSYGWFPGSCCRPI